RPPRRRLPALDHRRALRRRGAGGRGPGPAVQQGARVGPVDGVRRRSDLSPGVRDDLAMRTAARVAGLRPTAVNSVLREVRQLQAEGRDLVSLMRGQPDTPTPAHVVEAAQRALRDGRTGYPDNQGEPGLRRAVAEALARDHGLTYDPAREVLITDGATLGVCTALATLVGPGDDVLLPDPVYDAYASPIALWGGNAVPVPSEVRAGRFVFDRAGLESRRGPSARAVLVNTPWNPVGTVLTPPELQEVVGFVADHRLILISD